MHRGYLVYVGAEGCKACKASTPVVKAVAQELGVPLVYVDYFKTRCVIDGVQIDETPFTVYVPDGRFDWSNALRGPAVNKPAVRRWLEGRIQAAIDRGALFCGRPS